jgi:hypothetical protein
MIKKLYTQFADLHLRQNFKTLGQIFGDNPYLKGEWKFLALTIPNSGVKIKIPHTLGFQPLDIIVLSSIGGAFGFNYTLFDSNNLSMNVSLTVPTVPLTVRMFVGRYTEDAVNV